MAEPGRARSIFEAGGCEVDLGQRELRTDGVPTPIGGRAFEIIEALVRADGRLVTKNELMDLVWPGTIVGDNTLQVHISAVRKALGARRGMLKTEAGRGVEPRRYARAASPARKQVLAPVYGRFAQGFSTTDLTAAKALLDTLS